MIKLKDVMFIKCEEYDPYHNRANKYGMRTLWRADYHGKTIASLCDTKAECIEKVKEYIRLETHLDYLVRSSDYYDRIQAAEQGYKLDILINDENELVRAAVARQEYRLDVLINDESELVRLTAKAAQNKICGKRKTDYDERY